MNDNEEDRRNDSGKFAFYIVNSNFILKRKLTIKFFIYREVSRLRCNCSLRAGNCVLAKTFIDFRVNFTQERYQVYLRKTDNLEIPY